MPVLPFGKCIEIARHRDGWQILVEDASIFLYTQSIVSFPGFFQWEKEQNSLYFYNQTKTKLENLVYLEQGFYQSLEKKDTDSFPYCPVSFWNTSQMPPFWQENRLLFWLREIFPTPFITAHKEPSSNNTNHFAFRAQKCLVCIFQNTKNTPKKSDQ